MNEKQRDGKRKKEREKEMYVLKRRDEERKKEGKKER
jgi:hypothetical protein